MLIPLCYVFDGLFVCIDLFYCRRSFCLMLCLRLCCFAFMCMVGLYTFLFYFLYVRFVCMCLCVVLCVFLDWLGWWIAVVVSKSLLLNAYTAVLCVRWLTCLYWFVWLSTLCLFYFVYVFFCDAAFPCVCLVCVFLNKNSFFVFCVCMCLCVVCAVVYFRCVCVCLWCVFPLL